MTIGHFLRGALLILALLVFEHSQDSLWLHVASVGVLGFMTQPWRIDGLNWWKQKAAGARNP